MLWLRSACFNLLFIMWSLGSAILFMPFFLVSSRQSRRVGRWWARVSFWLLRVICGVRYEVRGREHIAQHAVIYASKHQSAWETLVFHVALPQCPAFILKRELLHIPLWGWYLWRMGMIAINRKGGASSIKHMVKQARAVRDGGRSVVIFPEGTRMPVGAAPNYHAGVAAMYSQMHVPVVPVALNSGVFWGKNGFVKYPGVIVLEFLPAIPPGMNKETFMQTLQQRIENACAALPQSRE
jgi:1-acyl-sn-glycerol-3-phosphate acyltransferase